MARLPNGDKPGPKTSLRTSLDTLRATLLLPTTTEHRKLPKDTTPLLTTIHTSWLKFTTPDNLPPYKTNSYATLVKAPTTDAISNKRPATQITDTLPTPDANIPAPLHIIEINVHKTFLHKTIYHINQLKTARLTAKHLCQHIHSGFSATHRNTSPAYTRRTRTPPSSLSSSESHGKLHGSRRTLSDPSPTVNQQIITIK